ncbi:hypothetical protein JCM5350_000382 [Sporobolomyces pararoseus]
MEDILDYPDEPEWVNSAYQSTSSQPSLTSAVSAQEAHLGLPFVSSDLQDILQHQAIVNEALEDSEEEMVEVDSEVEVELRRGKDQMDTQRDLIDLRDELAASPTHAVNSFSLSHFQSLEPVSSPPSNRQSLLKATQFDSSPSTTPLSAPKTSTTRMFRTPSPVLILDSEDNNQLEASPTSRLCRFSQDSLQAQSLVTPPRRRLASLRRNSTSSDSSSLLRTPLSLLLDDSCKPFDRQALSSTGKLIDPLAATRSRASSPTQAEMDAFFGYNDPLGANLSRGSQKQTAPPRAPPSEPRPEPELLPLPLPPLPVSALALSSAQTPTISALKVPPSIPSRSKQPTLVKLRKAPASTSNVILSPIVNSSAQSSSEKRNAIISALQRLSLDILQRLVKNVQTLTSSTDSTTLATESQHSASGRGRNIIDPEQENSSTLQPEVLLSIELSRRGGRPQAEIDYGQGSTAVGPPTKKQRIVFPRKLGKGKEARLGGRELACFLRVVELVLDGLVADVVSTKRDLYYRDVSLFRKQQTVDSLVEDLAATLGVRRSDLNIVASSKGIFSGDLTLLMRDGARKSGSVEGTLIPPALLIDRVKANALSWVLVVEKDAVFQSLSPAKWDPSLGNGVVLTAKGYPDISTRELVKKLADDFPTIPIIFLVDADPHGIEILSTYVLGSSALSHDSSNLAIGQERAKWIGLKPSSLIDDLARRDESLSLSSRDRRKAIAMMKREWLPAEWRRELEYMLHLNRKAEIEILSSSTSPLSAAPSGSLDAAKPISSSGSRLVEFVATEVGRVLSKTKVQGVEEQVTGSCHAV